jgi:hypothetical protein
MTHAAFLNVRGLTSQGHAYRWRWRVVLGLLLLVCIGVVAIAVVNAWRAVTIVRPPRIPVDTASVERALPGAEEVTFSSDDGVVLTGS